MSKKIYKYWEARIQVTEVKEKQEKKLEEILEKVDHKCDKCEAEGSSLEEGK